MYSSTTIREQLAYNWTDDSTDRRAFSRLLFGRRGVDWAIVVGLISPHPTFFHYFTSLGSYTGSTMHMVIGILNTVQGT